MEKFAFCGITVEPIQLQTHCAPQNDHLNLIFEKKRKEMTRNVCKMVIYEVTIRLGESDFIFTTVINLR